MPLFIAFIVGAVILGAGSMLSPTWDTRDPRVGLGATFCLAIILGGTVFYAESFGWDTLVVDYLLFALMSFVVLGGTLSHGLMRQEAKGEAEGDEDLSWPGPLDLAFFGLVALLILIPLLTLPLPLGTEAQATGYHTLTAKLGGTFDTLAPFHPDTEVIYAPGFPALTAYLSQQLRQPIPMIHLSVASVLALLAVWLMYDFGGEIEDKRLGRAMAFALLLGMSFIRLFLGAHFTELTGLLFGLAFWLYTIRVLRHQHWLDVLAGGLMLGAVAYSDMTVLIIILLGYIPWLITLFITHRPTIGTYIRLALGIPLIALIGTAPWWLKNLDQLRQPLPISESLHLGYLANWFDGVGIVLFPIMVIGVLAGWYKEKQYRPAIVLCLGWLLLIADVAGIGLLASAIPFIADFASPSKVTWIGGILPISILAGIGFIVIWDKSIPPSWRVRLRETARYWMLGVGVVIVAIGFLLPSLPETLQSLSKTEPYPTTADDISAMLWLRDNTPDDAIILNHPELGAWVPIIAEREAVFEPTFIYFDRGFWTQDTRQWRQWWNNPDADMLADMDYVIVPSDAVVNLSDLTAVRLPVQFGDAWVFSGGVVRD